MTGGIGVDVGETVEDFEVEVTTEEEELGLAVDVIMRLLEVEVLRELLDDKVLLRVELELELIVGTW